MYSIVIEVSGSFGMFADPSTGSEATSFILPPPSACKGIIDAICRLRNATVNIVAVGICRPPAFENCTTNSYSSKRKSDLQRKGAPTQLHETILSNPCFQIAAVASGPLNPINQGHSLQKQIYRRIENKQSYWSVSLGRSEFMANYVGLPKTKICEDVNAIIPGMPMGRVVVKSRTVRQRQRVR